MQTLFSFPHPNKPQHPHHTNPNYYAALYLHNAKGYNHKGTKYTSKQTIKRFRFRFIANTKQLIRSPKKRFIISNFALQCCINTTGAYCPLSSHASLIRLGGKASKFATKYNLSAFRQYPQKNAKGRKKFPMARA